MTTSQDPSAADAKRDSNASSFSSESNDESQHRKRKRRHKEKRQSREKKKRTSKHRRTQEDDSDSSVSLSTSSSSYERRRRKRKKKEKKRRKKKESKKEDRRRKTTNSKEKDASPSDANEGTAVPKAAAINDTKPIEAPAPENKPLPDEEQKTKKRTAMIPMSREQYEAQQAEIREVYDEETGRYRLVRGTGEIIERLVSREAHLQINQRATQGDGSSFARHVMSAASNRSKKK